jgi:hypothetical protein
MRLQAMYKPVGTGQSVAIGAGSTQSANVIGNGVASGEAAAVCGVWLVSDVDCWVELGPNPTAAANTSTKLPATTPVYWACGANDKVAVIQDSAAGSLKVRAMAAV